MTHSATSTGATSTGATSTGAAGATAAPKGKSLIGFVVSDKMTKSVVVEVVRSKMDPVYKKYVKVRKRYKAHDEKNEYRVGDRVEMLEQRPISKTKRWKVVKLLERPARD